MHGRYVEPEIARSQVRIFAEARHLVRPTLLDRGAYELVPPRPRLETFSYTRQELWVECESRCRRYTAFKRIVYYVIDGGDLGRRERMEFERNAELYPWAPANEPSLVYEFEEWWRWARYRHRVDEDEARMIDRRGPWWDQ